MACFQKLLLDSNVGDLKITDGNVVNLVEVIRRFSIKTPVLDFKISGNYIELYYKDELGITTLKRVLLPPSNNNSIGVQSTNSITATIVNGIITSSTKISQIAGNKLSIANDGLYVNAVETPLVATSSSSITFITSGVAGHTVTGIVNVSADAGNALAIRNDGLYVSPSTPAASVIRALFAGTVPITYDNTLGIIGITQATTSVDGYITSTDWNIFNGKVSNGTALGTGVNPFKQKTGTNLEFRSVKGGIGISTVLSGDDILVNYTYLPPTVNAGTNQTIASSLGTVNLAGAVIPNTGSVVSATWVFLNGPSVPTISDFGITNPVVTGLSVAGVYKLRLLGINSVGLSNSSDISITVTSGGPGIDTIYYGAQSSATPPNAGAVAAAASFTQSGAIDVPINWTAFNSTPLYCWAAIPDLGSAYIKHKWYVDALNNGNMALTTDLFGNNTTSYVGQVTISTVVYNLYFTNYQTQFSAVCNLKNA